MNLKQNEIVRLRIVEILNSCKNTWRLNFGNFLRDFQRIINYTLWHDFRILKSLARSFARYFKDHVKSVLRISSAHNKRGPTDINIAQICIFRTLLN
jgi:hypothetical protein